MRRTVRTATAAILFLILGAAMTRASETPFFHTEPVFPFDETRPANHASSIAAMPNGL